MAAPRLELLTVGGERDDRLSPRREILWRGQAEIDTVDDVYLDADLLERAMVNVTEDAVAHARRTVRIGLESTGSGVHFLVDDDGPGIPEADRATVFERFVRLDDTSARTTGGTGIGLALVRTIVEHRGGAVSIETSAVLGGARFVLALPSQ